jgi:multidrug efflux pump subunit AcrB
MFQMVQSSPLWNGRQNEADADMLLSPNPARFTVERWQFTLLAFALLSLLGLSAFLSIPRSEDPHFPIPIVITNVILPGADASDVEELLIKPIEDAVDGLDDVKEIRSFAGDGVASILVEFEWSTKPERKYDEVVREINAIRASLPQGIARLDIRRARTTETNILQVALVSDTVPWRTMEKISDDLREELDRSFGVRRAEYWGAPRSEARVAVNTGRLADLKISPTQVSDALRAAGTDTPVGSVHAGERRFNIKTSGSFDNLDAIGNVPVAAAAGRVVRVRDVADVSWETGEATHLTYFNGKRAMFVTVKQRDNVDVQTVRDGLATRLDAFEKRLPAGIKMERAFDQSVNVKHRLGNLYRDFGIALGLVLITLLPLGIRAGFVVMLSIPMSLLIGIFALQMAGFTLNQLSIAGFVLALGLLVDDSIVVTENIARRIREGEDRVSAAINGTAQIGIAVIGCTATLMLAFLPLMFLPEGSGKFIKSLPVTVLLTVAASLFVSLTVIPFLASRMLKNDEDPEGNFLLRRVNGAIHAFYTPILHKALARPWAALGIIMAISFTAFPIIGVIGQSLFPPAGIPQFLIRIETPEGTSLEKTKQAMNFVETRLETRKKANEVDWYMSNLGRGNPQIFYNIFQRETASNYAEIAVQKNGWKGQGSLDWVETLRDDIKGYPGARFTIVVFENGPPVEAPIAVRIFGEDLNTLKSLSQQTMALMESTAGVRDVVNPLRLDRTDIDLGVDTAQAAALGVPAGAERRIARLALAGEVASTFRDDQGDDYPVIVRLPMSNRNTLEDLDRIYVPTNAGGSTPLSAFATPKLISSAAVIARVNRERVVTLTAQTQEGFLTATVTADMLARITEQIKTPPGFRVELGGQAAAQSESFSGLGAAFMIALFGILAVLVLEFGKFKTAIVVAGIIPLGIFGAVGALAVTGYSMSFTATIGIIALIGIEIKNSILLVDFTEQLRREGVGLMDAIEKAGEIRFLPVLLTSITAIGGLLPLAFEQSGLYSPLAIAIIGGLITSTFLSRVATPVMYYLTARDKPDGPSLWARLRALVPGN